MSDTGIVALIKALAPKADPAVIEAKVEEWLDAHPEATTTVQDGSITEQKLATSIAQKLGLISSLSDEIDAVGRNETVATTNKLTPPHHSGYWWDGEHASTGYIYVNITGLKQGDVLSLRSNVETESNQIMRFIDAYNGSTRNANAGSSDGIREYTVPANVDNVYVSYDSSYTSSLFFVHTTETVFVPNSSVEPNRFIYNFNVVADGTYTAERNLQDICGYKICFFAKVENFSGITRIGKGESLSYGGAVGFDATNLYTYISGDITTPSRTQAHGLTIKDYIGLTIDMGYNSATKIELSTNGGTFIWEVPFWQSQQGQMSVYSASALSDCVLSYTCEGILKESWLYGDSYFANTGTNRWTAYLVKNGYRNYLLNGYPGRNSLVALDSLKTDLQLGKVPKRIIWCMGMNNPDQNATPNQSWLNALIELKGICKKHNIELVLATIPNAPSVVNEYKNAYVKASGYRYIPFASAISADESSTWYDGMLETVSGGGYGVHPTDQGALCLYNCAVSAVPELLL